MISYFTQGLSLFQIYLVYTLGIHHWVAEIIQLPAGKSLTIIFSTNSLGLIFERGNLMRSSCHCRSFTRHRLQEPPPLALSTVLDSRLLRSVESLSPPLAFSTLWLSVYPAIIDIKRRGLLHSYDLHGGHLMNKTFTFILLGRTPSLITSFQPGSHVYYFHIWVGEGIVVELYVTSLPYRWLEFESTFWHF